MPIFSSSNRNTKSKISANNFARACCCSNTSASFCSLGHRVNKRRGTHCSVRTNPTGDSLSERAVRRGKRTHRASWKKRKNSAIISTFFCTATKNDRESEYERRIGRREQACSECWLFVFRGSVVHCFPDQIWAGLVLLQLVDQNRAPGRRGKESTK